MEQVLVIGVGVGRSDPRAHRQPKPLRFRSLLSVLENACFALSDTNTNNQHRS
jgi:hypothetical protein